MIRDLNIKKKRNYINIIRKIDIFFLIWKEGKFFYMIYILEVRKNKIVLFDYIKCKEKRKRGINIFYIKKN